MTDLEKENLFLRYQILVLKRQCPQPKFTASDRFFMALMTKRMRFWARACMIIKPATLLGWHRKIAAWTWTTKQPGREEISVEVRDRILQVKREDAFWDPKRIHGKTDS